MQHEHLPHSCRSACEALREQHLKGQRQEEPSADQEIIDVWHGHGIVLNDAWRQKQIVREQPGVIADIWTTSGSEGGGWGRGMRCKGVA